MLKGSQSPPLIITRKQTPSPTTVPNHCCCIMTILLPLLLLTISSNNRTGKRNQLGRIGRMAEISNTVPILGVGLSLLLQRENDSMNGRFEQAICPIAKEIPYIDQDWWWFFCTGTGGRLNRYRSP